MQGWAPMLPAHQASCVRYKRPTYLHMSCATNSRTELNALTTECAGRFDKFCECTRFHHRWSGFSIERNYCGRYWNQVGQIKLEPKRCKTTKCHQHKET